MHNQTLFNAGTDKPGAQMRGSSATPWLVINRPNPQARLRLFCFPYAGGGAATYHAWPGELPTEVEVCAVQLPGRASRSRESPYDRLKQLVEALAPAVLPYLDRPYAFFGHTADVIEDSGLQTRKRKIE